MPLADGEMFAGFTIVRLLGSGGMGEVYLARHPRLPRQDALKVLPASVSADAEFRERFNREADLAATLWHPHIVGVHDRGEFDDRLWISMDYVQGTDAARLSREQYPDGMAAADVVEIISAVAEALDYAHSQRLLHRDVKPANILLTEPGNDGRRRILLADFGIARHTDDVTGLTATNMTIGSVSYTAPEQLLGEDLDGRADQYALAATAFHLLSGAPPFPHTNPTVVISRHLNTAPPAISTSRPQLADLDEVLTRALSKNPADRFDSCRDFANALAEAGSGLGHVSTATPAAPLPVLPSSATPKAVSEPAAAEPTVQHHVPPVVVSKWGADEPLPHAPDDVETLPEQPAPSPRLVPPALIATAAVAAIVVIALLTYVILQNTGRQDASPAPRVSSTATTAPSLTPAEPTATTTVGAPETTTSTRPLVNCGVDLHSPTVLRAVKVVEPTAMYPLDADYAWGNYDPCAELSVALIPTAMGTGSSPVEALMFHEGDYVGKATPTGTGYLRFNEDRTTGDTVVLTFRTTLGSCGGCDDATYADVRFQWRDGKVVALDPIPHLFSY